MIEDGEIELRDDDRHERETLPPRDTDHAPPPSSWPSGAPEWAQVLFLELRESREEARAAREEAQREREAARTLSTEVTKLCEELERQRTLEQRNWDNLSKQISSLGERIETAQALTARELTELRRRVTELEAALAELRKAKEP